LNTHIDTMLIRQLAKAQKEVTLNIEQAQRLGKFLQNFVEPNDYAQNIHDLLCLIEEEEGTTEHAFEFAREKFAALNEEIRSQFQEDSEKAGEFDFEEALRNPTGVDDYRLSIALSFLEDYAQTQKHALPYPHYLDNFTYPVAYMDKNIGCYQVSAFVTRSQTLKCVFYKDGQDIGQLQFPLGIAREMVIPIVTQLLRNRLGHATSFDQKFANALIRSIAQSMGTT
jgi:hypothetical protein